MLAHIAFVSYLQYKNNMNLPSPIQPKHLPRTILSLNDKECWHLFRFKQNDLFRLITVFKISEEIRLENKSCFYGEEVLLFSLHHFAHGLTYMMHSITLFGREHSQWLRAFHWFIQHMTNNFIHLLSNNLEYWLPPFPHFSECIRLK